MVSTGFRYFDPEAGLVSFLEVGVLWSNSFVVIFLIPNLRLVQGLGGFQPYRLQPFEELLLLRGW
jgi:hypothetical protein